MDKKKDNPSILIIDDIEENLRIIGNILAAENISISIANSGEHALKILSKKAPDLILLDITMPEMDGYEVCIRIKNNESTKHIPIIFLTARTEMDDIVYAFEIGAVDYITKPFNKDELLSRVFTHLNLKKSRDIINKQKKELQAKNKELEIHKNKIEEQHNSIVSSIQYAKIIQQAIFPSKDILKGVFPESFILNIPKDIVSGDFYWFKQVKNTIFIAAADCTGHGVPGAFMSMLGISNLNDIYNTLYPQSEIRAAEILDLLRYRIKNALNQTFKETIVRDGIDMALCIIDTENNIMQYAGANNPVYIIHKNKDSSITELIEYKADKMPISIHANEHPFTNHIIGINSGDNIYMFSDGYVDQFGGAHEKKFLVKRLKKLLLESYYLPMREQKDILYNNFNEWKGNHEQIDDVMIIGLKIN